MSLAIKAVVQLLQDRAAQIQNVIKALEYLEESGAIPKETPPSPPPRPPQDMDPGITMTGKRASKSAPKASTDTKRCAKCGKTKVLDLFPKNKGCRDGHTHECKECCAARHRGEGQKISPSPPRPSTPKLNGKFDCKTCHCSFLTKASLDNHNCLK